MIAATLLAGLGAVGVGGLLVLSRRAQLVGLWVEAAGAAAIAVAGFAAFAAGDSFGAAFTSAFEPRLGVDPLSGFFLGMLGLVAAPALVYAPRYLRTDARGRRAAAAMAPFLLALALIPCARDPLTLLAGWELMTLVPALIILAWRDGDRPARRSVFTYLAVTHLGGVGSWAAILALAQADALGGTSTLAPGSAAQAAIAVAAIVGMGTKAGVMPLHVWLPRAHPLAPAPVSALMSGVMIKLALYVLIRVLLEWIGPAPVWIGVLLLGLGVLSALGGIVYALFQRDLKRLLAFSSIENVGVILLGIGACLTLRARGADEWAALALAAALLHALNHAVFKSLLFLGAGSFERAAGSLRLDRLGGLLGRMPWTGAAVLVGAMAIAALPPLNGFASEWLTFQALLRVPFAGALGDGLAGALALAALAATAALALLCFAKAVGLVLLGPPRTEPVAVAVEVTAPMRGAVAFLALACVALGLLPGLLLGALLDLAGAPTGTHAALDVPGTGDLPTPAIALVLVALAGGLALLRTRRGTARSPSWACGQHLGPELSWSSAGFTKPVRLVLEGVLRPRREIAIGTERGIVTEVTYRGWVPHLIDDRVYRPLATASLGVAARARRLQSGSLGTYVGYLIALVVVLLAAARVGVIG